MDNKKAPDPSKLQTQRSRTTEHVVEDKSQPIAKVSTAPFDSNKEKNADELIQGNEKDKNKK